MKQQKSHLSEVKDHININDSEHIRYSEKKLPKKGSIKK